MPTRLRAARACRTSSRSSALVLMLAALSIVTASCAEDSAKPTSPGPGRPRLMLSTHAIDDTINALIVAPLTVTVTDSSGRPAVDEAVTLTSTDLSSVAPGTLYTPVRFTTRFGSDSTVALRTDSTGQASVRVRLQYLAGKARIQAIAPRLGVRDTVMVTIRTGMPWGVQLGALRDTAVYPGADVQYAVTRVVDGGFNTLAVSPTWTSRRPDVATVDPLTGRVHSAAIGRVWIVATAGKASDSVALSVVPTGDVAARSLQDFAIYRFNLDGSSYRRLGIALGNNVGPRWLPDGRRLILHQVPTGRNAGEELFTMDTTGILTRFAAAPGVYSPNSPVELLQPQPTGDGQTVVAVLVGPNHGPEVWRVGSAGELLARVGPSAGSAESDLQPSLSPDGSRLAMYSNRGRIPGTGSRLQLYETATGRLVNTEVDGRRPRWSPDGREVAYLADRFGFGQLEVMSVDGTGRQPVGPAAMYDETDGQLDWSPDGAWILACRVVSDRMLVLVNRRSGEMLPLAFTGRDKLCEPTWRR